MSLEEHTVLLGSLPFMLEMPESLKQQVCRILLEVGEFHQVEKGAMLFREGDQHNPDGYVLLSGSVRVAKSYAGDAQAFAPVLLGEVQQFNPRSERTATVEALEDLDTLHFTWDRFHNEVQARLDDHEREVLRKALLEYAWLHLLN